MTRDMTCDACEARARNAATMVDTDPDAGVRVARYFQLIKRFCVACRKPGGENIRPWPPYIFEPGGSG